MSTAAIVLAPKQITMAGDDVQERGERSDAERAAAKAARKEKYSPKHKRPAGSFDWTCALCGAVNFGSKRRELCLCGAQKGAAPVSEKRVAKRRKLQASGKKVNRSGAAKRKAKRARAADES